MSAHTRPPRILVVDDEPVLLQILQRMLSRSYEVLTASSLDEAWSHLESVTPDLVLTDLRLGGGERGEELIERVGTRIPCVAMTAFGDRQLERAVRERGAVGYLAKPFGSDALFDAVRGALSAADAPTVAWTDPRDVALVLSGGGIRGAYEAGVLAGIVEALQLGPDDPPPFRVFVGTSVGAINAAWLAANAHRGDLDVAGLGAVWASLRYRDLVRLDVRSLLGIRRGSRAPSLLRVGPIANLVRDVIDWNQLHRNVSTGAARALVMPALNVRTGRSVMFAEVEPGADFQVPEDHRRTARLTRITADHVMASAALPWVFPPRFVEGGFYVDGGLRHNVPIAPAIRAGASHLVVVSALTMREPPVDDETGPPGPAYLLGKLMNAMLLDPLQRDLAVMERFNRLLGVLEKELTPDQLDRVAATLTDTRGLPYRRIHSLVFTPGEDIGGLARDHLQTSLGELEMPGLHRWAYARALQRPQPTNDADWATYVLFDGTLGARLLALGRADALARTAEIRSFFGR